MKNLKEAIKKLNASSYCDEAWQMKNIEYVNVFDSALEVYYDEIININDLCDLDLLKNLFDEYMIINNIKL